MHRGNDRGGQAVAGERASPFITGVRSGNVGTLASVNRVERAGACVVGGVEVVRALGMAGIRSAVVAPAGAPVRLSRFAVDGIDPAGRPLADALLEYGASRASPPVLLYDSDDALLEISRRREELARSFRFALPEAGVVEDMVDKARFQALAERLGLPVPRAQHVRPAAASPAELRIEFPLILKAVPFRDERWTGYGEAGKVLAVDDADELERLWPRLAAADLDLIAQERVPGGEDRVVSYHVYVDRRDEVAGDFTGRKIRTYPTRYGMSSALETTADPPLLEEGRRLVHRLGLRGPAKLDFKRTPDGRIVLLEVNLRYTLWVHAGALAGVNLAALAHADLTGRPLPATGPARAGVRWIQPRLDFAAARETGVPLHRWMWFAARCQSNQLLDPRDPVAVARRYGPTLRRRARRARAT